MLSALLVDDEPLANERMRSLLTAHGGIAIAAVAGDLTSARAVLEEQSPDVVFLDVEMPGCTGLELLPSVPAGMQVVFVTADEKYAVEGFSASALDYLVKPVTPERPSETLRRLEEMKALLQLRTANSNDDAATMSEGAAGSMGAEGVSLGDTLHVPLEGKGRSAFVTIGEICWIESLRNYTRVGLRNPGRVLLLRRRLGEWEADLEPLVIGRAAAMRLRDILSE
jgi:two-component system LytT family response regulator